MRKQNLPNLLDVHLYQVADHRYKYDRPFNEAELEWGWRETKNNAPYKAGEVVFVVYGGGYARAYIHYVGCDKTYLGDWREYYDVRRETKAGKFSKKTLRVHPGQIQRGYQRAGLAPEMPDA